MRLHQAIALWSTSEGDIGVKQASSAWAKQTTGGLAAQAIPIKRMGTATSIVYVCAIAHRLAKQPHHAATIAAQLVDNLRRDLPSHRELLRGVTVHATEAGFIHFEVSDRTIAAWLDLLLANALPEQPSLSTATDFVSESERQLMVQSAAVFEVQHAHARCCSLLKLAHREALVRLENLEEAPVYWRFSSPASLPWLTSAAQLYFFSYAVDRCLLGQLLDAFDHLSDPSRRQTQASLLRSAQTLAQALQSFHREHSWYSRAGADPITLTRLGLLMATQRVLYLLLWDGLDLCPAVEL